MRLKLAVLLITLLSHVAVLHAASLRTLQADGHVKIKTWIEAQDKIIAKQQVQLNIEIATDSRFAAGTRIGHAEVEDAIVLQREAFAVNSTRHEAGKSWVVQQWSLSIYPQRGGVFSVPAIALHVSIIGEKGNAITGTLHTTPLQFTAMIPPDLQNQPHDWVATDRLAVSDTFNREMDELKPGDAIVRTIRISTNNLLAMMLPAAHTESIDGIAVYQKTPKLSDRSNRGDYIAERVDVLTYVFEKPGHYVLPARSYTWWNLESESMEVIELPEYALSVAGGGSKEEAPEAEGLAPFPWRLLLIVMLAVLIGVALWQWRKKHPPQPAPVSRSELLLQFKKACKQHQMQRAVALFYQWLDHGDGQSHAARVYLKQFQRQELQDGFEQLMHVVYADKRQGNIDLNTFANQLLRTLKAADKPPMSERWRVTLKIN